MQKPTCKTEATRKESSIILIFFLKDLKSGKRHLCAPAAVWVKFCIRNLS